MKTTSTFLLLITFSLFITGCDKDDLSEVEQPPKDLINPEFAESKAEIQIVLDGIFKSIQENDADKLISYHIYGPKFTEFRDSEHWFGSADNEA